MAPESRFFRASFPAAVLRSSALAIALLVQASPARAEPVTLSCRFDEGQETLTLRVNYATGLVERLAPSGEAYSDRIAPNASISNNAIVWSVKLIDATDNGWKGTIDRLSGTGWEEVYRESFGPRPMHRSFTCRQATQKF